jgi:hypothetical protein
MSEESCLHCQINKVVREHIEGNDAVNLAELVAKVGQSLVELIQVGPEDQWAISLHKPLDTSVRCSSKRAGSSKARRRIEDCCNELSSELRKLKNISGSTRRLRRRLWPGSSAGTWRHRRWCRSSCAF